MNNQKDSINTENDNESDQSLELEDDDEEPPAEENNQNGDNNLEEDRAELSPYERLRDNNINERKRKMEEAGIFPHSQVIKKWKR